MKKSILLLATVTHLFIHTMENKQQDCSSKTSEFIVYHPDYNINTFGLQSFVTVLGPLTTRPRTVLSDLNISNDHILTAQEITETNLKHVHTQDFLDKLKNSPTEMLKLACIPASSTTENKYASYIPNCFSKNYILHSMRLATGGTIQAMELALKEDGMRFAFNLSGGYHHAKTDGSSYAGFCLYNDVAIATRIAIEKYGKKKILEPIPKL